MGSAREVWAALGWADSVGSAKEVWAALGWADSVGSAREVWAALGKAGPENCGNPLANTKMKAPITTWQSN